MEKEKILTELSAIFKEVFGDENLLINADTSPADIDSWDSLHQIGIISAIQKKYNIRVPFSDVKRMNTAGKIADMIIEKSLS